MFSDQATIKTARLQVRKLVSSKDTINGVHFYFTDKSKYKDYIEVIDMSRVEKISANAMGYNIYILNFKETIATESTIQPIDL